MENASKALLMAAGVLISVVVLSLAVFLYASFSEAGRENIKQMEQSQISGFNSKFTAYDGQTDLTYYDILNVTNMARQNNKDYELTEANDYNYYIEVKLDGKDLTKDANYNSYKISSQEDLNNGGSIMEKTSQEGITSETEDVLKLKKYSCTVTINENTGRVNLVQFSEYKNN